MTRGFVCALALAFACCGGSTTVGPDGGTIHSDDGRVTIDVPAGALSSDVKLTVDAVPDAPGGRIGAAYRLGPPGTHFAQPITVRIAVDDTAGYDLAVLGAATLDGERWVGIRRATVDVDAHALVIPIAGIEGGTSAGQGIVLSPCEQFYQSVTHIAVVPPIVVDNSPRGDDAQCAPQGSGSLAAKSQPCRSIRRALDITPAARKIQLVGGPYVPGTVVDPVDHQQKPELIPVPLDENHDVDIFGSVTIIGPPGMPAIIADDPLYVSCPSASGLTLQTVAPSPNDPLPPAIEIDSGRPIFDGVSSTTSGGIVIAGGNPTIRRSSFVGAAARLDYQGPRGGTNTVLQLDTFRDSTAPVAITIACQVLDLANDPACVRLIDDTIVGGHTAMAIRGAGYVAITGGSIRDSAVGLLVGGVLPPPAAPFSPDPTAGAPQIDIENTTFTNETAAAIVDAADHNAFSVDAASRLLGKAPGDPALDVWAGPAPWLGIADIVYLNDVPQHGRFWQVRPAGDVPSARFGAGMCWDGASRRFVLYGGAAARGFDDTFTLDPSTFAWRVATDARLDLGTGRRLDVAMASSFPGKSCLLFGGQSGDAVDVVYADLYRFVVNPQTLEPEWHKLSPACTPRCPDARFGASLSALDDHRYLLVGGRGAGGQFWGEWWIYDADANTWTDRTVATAPMYVAEHAATTAGGAGVLIYGGQDQNGSARDTAFVFDKSLDDGTHSPWRPVAIGSAAAGPGARSLLGMAIVPRGGDRRDRYVAFGGSDGVNYGDTGAVLVADGLVAGNFEATTGPRPSARGHYAMASSADLAKAAIASESLAGTTVVLFGGDPGVGQSPLADTWVYVVSAP